VHVLVFYPLMGSRGFTTTKHGISENSMQTHCTGVRMLALM